jgi:hypothetical protein
MSQENEEMRPEYDIRGGVRGKYFRQYSASMQLQDSPWIQPQQTASNGKHAEQSTIRIGAEPIFLTPRLEVSQSAHR